MDCIAWKDKYPQEFGEYFEVDYEKMFEKTVMSPLTKFLENHRCQKVSFAALENPNSDVFDI